jgi:hypothetical protein
MNDDRLLSALQRLGGTELPTASDRAIRGRLETAWTARASWSPMPALGLRRFAPALATVLLAASFGGAALGADADSPLWNTRIALEEAATFLRQSNDDRVAYLLDLVQSRTEEAARQEAVGNAGAAAKARTAAAAAVAELHGDVPQIEATVPGPSASTTPAAASAPSPSASPSSSASPAVQVPPSASPAPTQTAAPTATPTPIRTPSPTPTPTRTPSPTPLPSTGTKQPSTITGMVRDAAGNNVTNACISTSPTPPTSTTACTIQTKNGSYAITASVTPGQSITLYAYYTDTVTGALSSGSATGTTASPTTLMPTIALTPRR